MIHNLSKGLLARSLWRTEEKPMAILRSLCNAAFSVLFGLHVMVGAFGQTVAWVWLSRLMFWFGERAGTGRRCRQSVDELLEQDASANRKQPFVVRRFSHPVAIEELVQQVGGHAKVQTHSYSNCGGGGTTDETITLSDLTERIRQGMSTNAKSIVFAPEAVSPLLQGLETRVDRLRGTTGMPWTELARQFFIGGTDTFTRCHADPSLNCYLQLSGVKRWRLAPPSSACELYVLPRGNNISYNSQVLKTASTAENARYPAYERTDWYVVDLQPGDLLVIPPFWFHEVQNRKDESKQSGNGTGTKKQQDVVIGLAMNWLSPRYAWRQAVIMAAGSLLRPRLISRYVRPTKCAVDESIMTSCRQVCCGHEEYKINRDQKTE